jgi:hypothetical protein
MCSARDRARHEHVCRFDALRCIAALEHLEAGEFVPLQVVAAVVAAFKSAHGDGALGQVNVVPAQIASLADPKPMTVDQQADEPIALPCRLRLDATHNAKPRRKRPDQRRLQAQLDEAGRTRAAYSVDRAARLTRTALFPEHREVYQPQIGLQPAGGFMVIEATEAAPCSARQPGPGRLRNAIIQFR